MKQSLRLFVLLLSVSVFLLSSTSVNGAKGVISSDAALIVVSSPSSIDMEKNSEIAVENDQTADLKMDDAAQDDEDTAQKQEEYLRQALENSEIAAITREGNLLAISLKGDVTFDTGSTVIMPGLYSEIHKVADAMIKYPATVATIEGHTDSIGTESSNMNLSKLRAIAVKNLLVSRGVDSSRIKTIGFGESHPVASNDTEIGRMRNRRVEIKIDLKNEGISY